MDEMKKRKCSEESIRKMEEDALRPRQKRVRQEVTLELACVDACGSDFRPSYLSRGLKRRFPHLAAES